MDDLTYRQKAEIEMLRERIRQLEEILAPSAYAPPLEYGLTPHESRVFAHLASRDLATKQSIMLAIYSDRIDEHPEPKIVDVFVCKMRKKLVPFSIEIDTVWGQGYALRGRERFAGRVQ